MSDDTLTTKPETQEVTFINTFHTQDQEDQQKILQSLVQVTEEIMCYQPGFISATLHQSLDGKTVTNLACWRSARDLKQALETPGMLAHRETLKGLYPREGYLGRVVYTCRAQVEDPTARS